MKPLDTLAGVHYIYGVKNTMTKIEEQKFLSKIIKQDGCWRFNSTGDSFGYGRMRVGGKQLRAHRLSYVLFNGEIPEGMCVLHKCDNPICVNPNHLFLGTMIENFEDMRQKKRHYVPTNHGFKQGHSGFRGELNGMSKLTIDKVKEIRDKYVPYKYSQQKLADEYGVSRELIKEIVNYKIWVN